MKKITLLSLAAMAALAVSPALGQGTMEKHPMTMGHMDHSSMMRGLSPSEHRTAMRMMAKMTKGEKAAMAKCGQMCMMDGKKGVKMDGMDEGMMKDHMTMGMGKSEKTHMMTAMRKMTPAEKAVCKKMMKNCNMAGMMQNHKM